MNRKQHRAATTQGALVAQPASPGIQAMLLAAALQHHQAGRLNEAEKLYRQVLAVNPSHADSLHLLGVIAFQTGRHDAAVDMIGKAIAINAKVAAYHSNLGNAHKEQGRLNEAAACYRRAIALSSDYPEAYNNLGAALEQQGRLDEAVACYRKALDLRSDIPEAHNNLGNALERLGRLDEAITCYRKALDLGSDTPEAHNNLGNALQELGRLDEAVACYRKALDLRPDFPAAHNNLGNAFQKQGWLDEAVACCRRAIALRADFPEAHNNLGNALWKQGRLDEALASYDKAIALKPDFDFLQGQRLHTKMCICDWGGIYSEIEELKLRIERYENAAPPFTVISLSDCLQIHRKSAEVFVRALSKTDGTLPEIAKRLRHDKIRLGYFSADYRSHATSYLMTGLFEQHDRARFEIVAFSFGLDEKGAARERIAASFDRFIDVRHLSDKDVALLARSLEIDVAVDLKGFTTGFRSNIFAHRAAPLQVNYLGYPGTMGADYIDYMIADNVVIPDECQKYYSENIVYLPHSYQVNDRKRLIADKIFTRQELGLPENGFVYCCFNNNYKINPAVFDGWMRILGQVEGSVLWLLADNPSAERNLRREAAARGVAPERLIFAARLPVAEHLARQRAADLFIDTLPCNAHTTASDALWAGLPVLTCAGTSFPGRVAASLLSAIDLAELITTTAEDYERRAVELARDPAELARIRTALARNRLSTPLFDTDLFTRHIEAAYSQMYERYQAGLAPAPIRVAP